MTTLRQKFEHICAAATFTVAALTFSPSSASAQAATGAAVTTTSAPVAPTAAEAPESATPTAEAGEAAPAAPSASSEPPAAVDGATYRVRLRDLEQGVDELKEQIRRSHTRLSLLSDTILSGASGGARAEIEFVNDLSGAWQVVEAVFVLDGAVQYKKTDDTGVLAKQRNIPIFSGSVPTGDHTLQVLLKLRGHGFGVFSYLRGMEANLTSDHSFTLTDGKVLELKATAWEQGGPTTPVEEQPDIRFHQKIRSLSDMPAGAPAKSTTEPAKKPEPKAAADAKASSSDGKAGGGVSAGGGASK